MKIGEDCSLVAGGVSRGKAQRLVGLGLVLVVLVVGGMLIKNSLEKASLPEIIEKLPENVDLGLDRVHYSQSENGKESWVLDADRAAYQRQEDELALTGVELTFFAAGNFGDMRLTADSGVIYRQQKKIDLQGNVRISAASGEQFQTDSMQYDYAHKLVTTRAPLLMKNQQLQVSGIGMTLDLIQGKLEILQDVHARYEEPAPKGGLQ